jgi:putative ATP-dependent endonuclease of the OLD family
MRPYIKSLHIRGFKKFEDLTVDFNGHMNIIVGENEAGKSTILEAIKIVLYQMYRSADKAILKDLFNQTQVRKFKDNPSVATLPQISIEIELNLGTDNPRNIDFCGGDKRFGIKFECRFNQELGQTIDEFIREGKIPYEYYELSWKTFSGHTYYTVKRPLNLLSIDTSLDSATSSFNYYNKDIFQATFNEAERMDLKNKFRTKVESIFEGEAPRKIDDSRKFGIDSKKVILENVLSIFEDDVALENKGSGMENLIKMDIALKKKSEVDTILIEEPENHLSYTNLRQMLEKIESTHDSSQVILTTHNNLIASRLNLKNVLWITKNEAKSLNDVDEDTAKFFSKADNNSFLQFLLSPQMHFSGRCDRSSTIA